MFQTKVYVILKADPETGRAFGDPLGVKLTCEAAHAVAKRHAPAKVVGPIMATKSSD